MYPARAADPSSRAWPRSLSHWVARSIHDRNCRPPMRSTGVAQLDLQAVLAVLRTAGTLKSGKLPSQRPRGRTLLLVLSLRRQVRGYTTRSMSLRAIESSLPVALSLDTCTEPSAHQVSK